MIQLKPINQQVVVVLGASSGIGRETALQFARRGAKVVVSARSESKLASLVNEIQRFGGEVTPLVIDNLYEPVPKHDTIEGSLSDVLEIPSITDWLAKNPALKWGAMTGAIALAFLAAQAFNNEQN